MGNIKTFIENIKKAIYGKDVRQSIVDAIEQTYEDAIANGHTDMEVVKARGSHNDLNSRLEADKTDTEEKIVAEKNNRKEVVSNLQNQINSLASGSPKGVYATVSQLESSNPETGVYIVTADGHIYSWTKNGTSTIDLGVYQAAGISEKDPIVSTILKNINSFISVSKSKNLYNVSEATPGKRIHPDGSITDNDVQVLTGFIPVQPEKIITSSYYNASTRSQTKIGYTGLCCYNLNKEVVTGGNYNQNTFIVPSGVAFVRISYPKSTFYDIPEAKPQIELTDDGIMTELEPYFDEIVSLNSKIIKNNNIATISIVEEVVEEKVSQITLNDMTKDYACSLPKSKLYQLVGNEQKWYYNSAITPMKFTEIYISAGSIYLKRSNDYATFPNTESYSSANGYTWSAYDLRLKPFIVANGNTGYGYARRILEENISNCSLLAIGDSTIDHDIMTKTLLEHFTEKGKTITLLGTIGDLNDPLNKNEGRAGWTSGDYLTNKQYKGVVNPFYNPTTDTFDFSYYMTNQGYSSVDFVVIQLGINDLYNFVDADNNIIWNNIKTMIDSILNFNNNIKIILNLPTTPNSDQSKHSVSEFLYRNRIIKYCQYVQEKALSEYGMNKVRCSYCHLILDPDADIRDNVHPTNEGYAKMALEVVNQINGWQNDNT